MVNACFIGQPFEKVSAYSTYWYFGENSDPASLRAIRFVRMAQAVNSFPFAVFELEDPMDFRGVQRRIVVIGTKGAPFTVNRVYQWPLLVTFLLPKDESSENWDRLQLSDLINWDLGYIEPTVFEGSPHYDLRAPGQIGEHLYDPNSDGSPGKMVKLPDGDWWLKELTAEE